MLRAVIKVCLAGATGWAGSELARGLTDDLELVSAVSRSHAGQKLGAAPVFATAAEAMAVPCDVFVEYTTASAARANILVALQHGAHVVVGSSGLTDDDFVEIDAVARERQRGVLACGNFAITMVLMQKFAEIAAKYVPSWQILDYAYAGKPDAPSGTARELAGRLAKLRQPEMAVSIADTVGVRESRGGTVAGTQIHSIRLPGFVIATEVILGLPDQKLTMRHDAGASAKPYVDGALLAIRKVSGLVGLHRGLDTVMEL